MEAKWNIDLKWSYIPGVKLHGKHRCYLRWVGILLYAPHRGFVWEKKDLW